MQRRLLRLKLLRYYSTRLSSSVESKSRLREVCSIKSPGKDDQGDLIMTKFRRDLATGP